MRTLFVLCFVVPIVTSSRSYAQQISGGDELRQLALETEAVCEALRRDETRVRAEADSLIAAMEPLPEGPVLSAPYEFKVAVRRLAVRAVPNSGETAFFVSRGDMLTAVQIVPLGASRYVVEVLSPDGSQRGYVGTRYVTGAVVQALREFDQLSSDLRMAEFRAEGRFSTARGELTICLNRVRNLTNRADRLEEIARLEEERARLEEARPRQDAEFYSSTPNLLVDAFYPSPPNSASGVDLHVRWRYLNPNKTVRYIRFTARPYNRVGDAQSCTVRGYSEFTGYATGPIDADTDQLNYSWDVPWYNNDISCMRLIRVRVEYTDGSSYTYARELPSILAEGVVNTCSMESQMPQTEK